MGNRDLNCLQGDFGEAWLEAVAAGCGFLHGRPTSLDLQKADVFLTIPGILGGTYNPTVLVQVKTTVDLRKQPNGDYSYDLDLATYDVLRRTDHAVRRTLVVIAVPKVGPRVCLHAEGTLLIGHGAWVSLEGAAESANTTSQTVLLPAGNTLGEQGLTRMMSEYGIRSSTPVPDVDVWESR